MSADSLWSEFKEIRSLQKLRNAVASEIEREPLECLKDLWTRVEEELKSPKPSSKGYGFGFRADPPNRD